MTDTTQAIRDALAAGPTPGPWHHKEWGSLILDGGTGSTQVLVATVAVNTRRDEGRHNAAFITACHPAAITALLAELDAVRADSARIDWLADKSQNIANVEVPNACVYANLSSLRGAIDMARSMHEAEREGVKS